VNADGHTDLGDTIAYSTIVRNVGTVTLHAVTVGDPLAGAVTCPTGSLAPGDQVTCIAAAAYSVSAVDVAAGQVANAAVAHALDPSGVDVDSAAATVHTPVG
jgi:trimeric autotransporter adhesin